MTREDDPLKHTPACELDRDNRIMTQEPQIAHARIVVENCELRAEVESLRGLNNQLLADYAKAETVVERLRAVLTDMIEISQRNSEATLMLTAIRKCAEHALGDKP